MRLRGTALDRPFLLPSDGPRVLQLIGEMRNTTHELAMVARALGTCPNEIGDRAAAAERDIWNLGVAAINDYGGTRIGIRTLILIRYLGDINASGTVSELGSKGYLIPADGFISEEQVGQRFAVQGIA